MKRIKKALSAVLVFAMLISMVGVVFAQDGENVLSDINQNTLVGKAVTELVKLSIISGYPDGTFKPDNTITRGEFARIIISFKGMDDIISESLESGFEDVDSVNHWAKAYIRLAVDQGIVDGYEDGTFRPDAPVRYVEAVKMIVAALDYGIIAENRNQEGMPWYSGYVSVASERGILQGAAINNQEDPAPRGIVAVLVYNSLDVVPAQVSTTGQVTIVDGGSTAREKFLGKAEVKGTVIGVYQTGLYSGSVGLAARDILVRTSDGDITYKAPSGYDTYSLLGYKISAFSERNFIDKIDNIVQITRDSQNKLTTITPDMIERVTENSITYYESETATRSITVTFNERIERMQVIYNGKYLPNPTIEDINGIKSGKIELLSNDGDNRADVIFITSYELFVVNSRVTLANNAGIKVYSKYDAGEIDIPSDENLATITRDGSKISATSIQVGDVLSVMRSRSADGKAVFNCIVTRKQVRGVVEESYGETKKRIGNTIYDFSYIFADYTGARPEFNVRDNVTVYLDHEGKIASAEVSSQGSNINVGYLVYAGYKKGGSIDAVGQIQVFGIEGRLGEQTPDLASRVRIDGELVSSYEEMFTKLRASAAKANDGKAAFDNELSLTEYSQLIRYTRNSKGEVDMIDTVEANTSIATDDLNQSIPFPAHSGRTENGSYKYVTSGGNKFVNGTNGVVMTVNSTTNVLIIPSTVDNSLAGFERKTISSAFSPDDYYRVEGYNVNDVTRASYVLVYKDSAEAVFNENSDIVMAEKVSTVEDGKNKLEGWNLRTGAKIKELLTESTNVFGERVDKGEIFRYATNAEGEIKEIDFILELEGNRPVFARDENGNRLDPVATYEDAMERRILQFDPQRDADKSIARFFYGTVVGRDDDTITVTNTLATDDCSIMEEHWEAFEIPTDAKRFLYDFTATASSDDRIKEGIEVSLDEIKTVRELSTAGVSINDATQVLVFTSSGKIKSVVIFKFK